LTVTLKTTDKIWHALEKAGATGATPKQLAELACLPVSDVRFFLKNRMSRKQRVIAALLPAGSRGQMYVLAKHAPAAPVEAPKKPPAKRGRPKAEPKPKPKPAPKAKPPAAPTVRREPPICSGTAPRITTGDVDLIPRMVCHRPGADAHLSVPSRQGDAFVPHRPPISMRGTQK